MYNWNSLSPSEKTKRANLQIGLEQDQLTYSIQKYWKSYNDQPVSGTPEQELIHQFVEYAKAPYEEWLRYFEEMPSRNQTNASKSHWSQPLLILKPETLAAIVISEIINTLLHSEVLEEDHAARGGGRKFSFQRLAKRIGKAVHRICSYQVAKKNFAEDWKRQSHFLKNWEPKRCDAFAKKMESVVDWTPQNLEDIGTHLLHLASKSEAIGVETRKVRINRKSWRNENMVYLKEDILTALVEKHAMGMMMRIVYRPMIVPPVTHELDQAGGALQLELRKNTVDGASRATQVDLDALNLMQNTEWAVNVPVLDVMDTMYKNNWEWCNLPPRDLEKVSFPLIPDDADPKTIAKIKDERASLWGEWYKSEQKRLQMDVRIRLGRDLAKLGWFYQAYTMDFRGRAYSTCTLLSPQSGDFDRGLIKFATPVQQTPEGMYWQKVALANAMDGAEGWNGEASDKASFDDRVAWVDANHDQLLEVADNPLELASAWADNETKKKNPSFQRLASIFDYAQAVREGTTSYPVQLDGACNGSQHWSSIMRDPKIAELTNVTPVDKPQDLYQYVANIASAEMVRRANEGDEWSQRFREHWGDTLSRKVVKRATMCDAYGITPHGVRKYAREEGHLDWVLKTMGKEHMAGAVNELASLTLFGLNGAMEASNMGKDFVRQLSDVCSAEGKPMEWLTSTGFRVVHRYPEYVMRASWSEIYNQRFKLKANFGQPTDDINEGAAFTGVAPNYIHSHDAAHMRGCIVAMGGRGITQFSMIHDSFGCPAPQVPVMRGIINEEFYNLHEDCCLVHTKTDVAKLLGWDFDDERLPAIPEYVDADYPDWFDISTVLGAEYIFG